MAEKTIDYICPKCKTKMSSTKRLEYCICGGKYEPQIDMSMIEQLFGDNYAEILKNMYKT